MRKDHLYPLANESEAIVEIIVGWDCRLIILCNSIISIINDRIGVTSSPPSVMNTCGICLIKIHAFCLAETRIFLKIFLTFFFTLI